MVRVTEGCKIEPGAGEEAFQEAGPVLHPFEPGPGQRGQLAEVAFGHVGQAGVSTPVIGREGLLRLVEWAGRLRARDPEGRGASGAVRTRASSPDDGADEGPGDGTVDVVSGGDPERHSGIAKHAPGAAGGLAQAGGGGDRG